MGQLDPFFYCVSYEILRETRIKPSFFGNCLIFLFPALGPSAWALDSRQWQLAAARAHREDSARARRGRVTLSALPWRAPPPKGEARLGSPFGRAGTAAAVTERATALPSGKGAGNQRLPGCFPSFFSGWRPLRSRARSKLF